MNILVTGGVGFIGSALCESLTGKGHRVTCYDNFDPFYPEKAKLANIQQLEKNTAFSLVRGDITDAKLLADVFARSRFDAVIHLAAKAGVRPSILDPAAYSHTNVDGTLNVLEQMQAHKVRNLVFASSSSIYGNNEKFPYAETDRVDNPISPYAATKKACELFTFNYHHLYRLNVVNLRFFTVFGPRQRPDLAIHKFFKSIYSGKPIDFYGDGTTGRDYTYIDDTVSGILGALDYVVNNENVYEIINLGNSHPVNLSELVDTIESVTGKKFTINRLPMQQGDVNLTFADISKAKKLLQYDPATNLRDGLVKFKEWFEKNHSEIIL